MRSFVVVFAALGVGCGSLPAGDAAIAEICQDLPAIDVPAAPAEAKGTFEWQLPLELPSAVTDLSAHVDLDVSLLRLVLTADGVSGFGFLDAVEVTARTAGRATPVVAWSRTEADPQVIALAPPEPLDLIALLADGAAELDASLTGTLPRSPWRLHVRACYAARARFTWASSR